MTLHQWRELAREINSDIATISRAVQIQSDVLDEIAARGQRPNEEFFIDEDAFGLSPTKPREISAYGAIITVWKIHRAGLLSRDIKGADLYYEIEGEKYVLVQYKTPDGQQRVHKDEDQLDELIKACPIECPPPNRFGCGSWYLIRSQAGREYFPACEALRHFGKKKSRHHRFFINGLTEERFKQDFGLCRIGARSKPIDIEQFREWSLENDCVYITAIRREQD